MDASLGVCPGRISWLSRAQAEIEEALYQCESSKEELRLWNKGSPSRILSHHHQGSVRSTRTKSQSPRPKQRTGACTDAMLHTGPVFQLTVHETQGRRLEQGPGRRIDRPEESRVDGTGCRRRASGTSPNEQNPCFARWPVALSGILLLRGGWLRLLQLHRCRLRFRW